jgi:hypothetical protein
MKQYEYANKYYGAQKDNPFPSLFAALTVIETPHMPVSINTETFSALFGTAKTSLRSIGMISIAFILYSLIGILLLKTEYNFPFQLLNLFLLYRNHLSLKLFGFNIFRSLLDLIKIGV